MRAVANRRHGHAILLRLFDDGRHRLVARDHTHAVVRVRNERGRRFANDLVVRHGVQNALVDAIQIDGFKAVTAVAFDAAAVALQEYIRADFRILQRHAIRHKRVGHKALNHVPRDIRSGFCHKSFSSCCHVFC
ncbi:hypothetical protein SDC9_134871 [bioreactor metagenome]|uniref:Uncharacterized protein n=1 Tax=bioreactor metagenome TaxID=1076179 RepID=A0A645DEU7_9ZZZZ